MAEDSRSTATPRRRTRKSSGVELTSSESLKEYSSESRGDKDKRYNSIGLSYRFVRVFSWVVLATWGVGFTVDMSGIRQDWNLPPGSWALMTLVAGGLFVGQAIKGKSDDA